MNIFQTDPRYSGRFSKEKVWIKVCNANFAGTGTDHKKKAEPKLRRVVWKIDILALPEFVFDFNPALP